MSQGSSIHTALYFDGIKAQAIEVVVRLQGYTIYLSDQLDNGLDMPSWDLRDCTISSLNTGPNLTITHGSFPPETLVIDKEANPQLIAAIHLESSLLEQSYQKLGKLNAFTLVSGSILTIVLVVFLYVQYLSPWVGEKAVRLIPKSVEAQIGNTVANNLSAFAHKDSIKTVVLNQFYKGCGFQSGYDVRLTYYSDGIVNAFAAPGGRIIVYNGIVDLTDSYDQLAGLLAHELAHVNQRHAMKNITRALSGYLVLSALTGDVGGVSSIILEQANQIQELSYSRTFEQEADESGLAYMINQGIDPTGMVALFESLQEYSGAIMDSIQVLKQINNLDFLRSHPTTTNRIDYLNEIIKNSDFSNDNNIQLDSLWRLLKDTKD